MEAKVLIQQVQEMNANDFDGTLTLAAMTSKELREAWHKLALYALFHSVQHGQQTPALRIVNTMHKADRRQAMIHWFETYSYAEFTRDDDDNIVGVKTARRIKMVKIDELPAYLEKMAANPYWLTSNEKAEPKLWIGDEKLAALIKQMRSKLEKGSGVVNAEHLVDLEELLVKWTTTVEPVEQAWEFQQ